MPTTIPDQDDVLATNERLTAENGRLTSELNATTELLETASAQSATATKRADDLAARMGFLETVAKVAGEVLARVKSENDLTSHPRNSPKSQKYYTKTALSLPGRSSPNRAIKTSRQKFFSVIVFSMLACAPVLSSGDSLDVWRWVNPKPTGNDLHAIAFGEGQFVAVGDHGTILTSTNATQWTQRDGGTQESIWDIAHGNGHYLAIPVNSTTVDPGISRTNALLISHDGIDWGSALLVSSNALSRVTFANGVFLILSPSPDAGGNEGFTEVHASTNGVDWPDQKRSSIPGAVLDVIFGNGAFLAVGPRGAVWTSVDAVEWTRRETGLESAFCSVAFSDGLFIAVGLEAFNPPGAPPACGVWASTNGIDWQEHKRASSENLHLFQVVNGRDGEFLALGGGGSSLQLISTVGLALSDQVGSTQSDSSDAIWGKGRFVSVGLRGFILTSNDGIAWTPLPERTQARSPHLDTVSYGNGRFVATGGWYDSEYSSFTNRGAFSSLTGGEWDQVLSLPQPETFDGLHRVTFVNGRFFGLGGRGFWTSADGLTWTARFRNHYDFVSAAYGNGLFIALSTQVVSTSVDGETWKPPEPLTITNFENFAGKFADQLYQGNCLTYGNGLFVAVGVGFLEGNQNASGAIWTSTNAVHWQQRHIVEPNLNSVAFGNGRFLAVGGGIILSSIDGISWYESTGGPARNIIYANGVFLGLMNFGAFGSPPTMIWTSSDGIEWKSRAAIPVLGEVTFGNARYLGVGNENIVQTDEIGPRLVATRRSAAGACQLLLLGESGRDYRVDASSNLVSWLPIHTNAVSGIELLDPESNMFPRRFYRAQVVPR